MQKNKLLGGNKKEGSVLSLVFLSQLFRICRSPCLRVSVVKFLTYGFTTSTPAGALKVNLLLASPLLTLTRL
jgi:hypothetical protein